MQQFIITIEQSDDNVNTVATLLGWDGTTGTAHDFVLQSLGPLVQNAVADIMLQPGKDAAQKAVTQAFQEAQATDQSLNAIKPDLINSITIQ